MRIVGPVITLALVGALQTSAAQAQFNTAEPFAKGDRVIQFGIGLGAGGADGSMQIPPIMALFDVATTDEFSLGAYGAYYRTEYRPTYLFDAGWNYSYAALGARGALHFSQLEENKLDPYVGVGLGYVIVSASSVGEVFGYDAQAGFFQVNALGGLRYWQTPGRAFFAEVGVGTANLAIGLALKI